MSVEIPSGLTQGYTLASSISAPSSVAVLGDFPSTPAGAVDGLLTELSEQLITEAGDFLIWEEAPFTNNYSLDFDGVNDYGTVAERFDFIQNTCDFSISTWVKFANHASTSNIQSILGTTYTASQKGFYLFYDNRFSAKTLRFTLVANSSVSINVNSAIIDNDWHNIIITAESSVIIVMFLDGTQIGTVATPNTTATTSLYDMKVGMSLIASVVSNLLDGKMDEAAIFDYGLSSSEVAAIYNSGVPANLTSYSPVGWWRMGDNDGGTGTTVTDQGSGGNNATLTNGPTFSIDVP